MSISSYSVGDGRSTGSGCRGVLWLRLARCLLSVVMLSAVLAVVEPQVASAEPEAVGEPGRVGVDPGALVSEPRDLGSEFAAGVVDEGFSEEELAVLAAGTGAQGGSALVPTRGSSKVERVREVESLRSSYGETFETADGGLVSDVSLEPKRFRDARTIRRCVAGMRRGTRGCNQPNRLAAPPAVRRERDHRRRHDLQRSMPEVG